MKKLILTVAICFMASNAVAETKLVKLDETKLQTVYGVEGSVVTEGDLTLFWTQSKI